MNEICFSCAKDEGKSEGSVPRYPRIAASSPIKTWWWLDTWDRSISLKRFLWELVPSNEIAVAAPSKQDGRKPSKSSFIYEAGWAPSSMIYEDSKEQDDKVIKSRTQTLPFFSPRRPPRCATSTCERGEKRLTWLLKPYENSLSRTRISAAHASSVYVPSRGGNKGSPAKQFNFVSTQNFPYCCLSPLTGRFNFSHHDSSNKSMPPDGNKFRSKRENGWYRLPSFS